MQDRHEYIEVRDGVATAYRDGEPVGEWQAGIAEYEAVGLEWSGCSCGEAVCRHGLAHYWGERWSTARLRELAAAR